MQSTRDGPPLPTATEEQLADYLKRLCSDVTLMANKDGFFAHWIDQISGYISDDFIGRFGRLSTDYERVQMAWQIKPVHSIKVERFYRAKDEASSVQYREDGNKAFRSKNMSEALLLYCRAVTRAPHTGSSLCLAYGNRSAALCHVGEHRWCLRDIRLALLHGYPADLRYKIYERAGQCYTKLSHHGHASACYQRALDALPQSGLDTPKLNTWTKTITRQLEECRRKLAQGEQQSKKYQPQREESNEGQSKGEQAVAQNCDAQKSGGALHDEDIIMNDPENSTAAGSVGAGEAAPPQPLFLGPSAALPRASAALAVHSSQHAGRRMVAAVGIPAGSVLVSEPPYASVLARDKTGAYCTHCCTRLVAPVPCPDCCGVAFCSHLCYQQSQAYHRWECPYLDLLHGSGMSLNCYLALRILTQHPLQYFLELRPELQKSKFLQQEPEQTSAKKPASGSSDSSSPPLLVPSSSSPHAPSSYLSVYHTVGLQEQRAPLDFLQRTLMAVLLLKVLQRAGYFGQWDEERAPDAAATDAELFVGALLLRNLQVLQFNAHEVSGMSFLSHPPSFQQSRSSYLGLAVYPTAAYCNHNCYPTLARNFVGTHMVVSSIRQLQEGEEVTENYGPVFSRQTREQRRRKMLSRYWFTCSCLACKQDWKTFAEEPSVARFKCPSCSSHLSASLSDSLSSAATGPLSSKPVHCSSCGASLNAGQMVDRMKDTLKLFENGKQLMSSFKREAAISALLECVGRLQQTMVLPCTDLHLAMEALRLLLAARGSCATLTPPPAAAPAKNKK